MVTDSEGQISRLSDFLNLDMEGCLDWLPWELVRRVRGATVEGMLKGLLFHQGGADAKSVPMAREWEGKLQHFVRSAGDEFGHDLPVFLLKLVEWWEDARRRKEHKFAGWEELKKIQEDLILANSYMVKTDDLPLKNDGLYLAQEGQAVLGKRFAHKIKHELY